MPRSSSAKPFPQELEPARKLLEAWRAAPERSRAIPEEVWTAVLDAASTVSPYRIARSLRLDYMHVKRRVEGDTCTTPRKASPQMARANFVEVQPSNLASQKACVLELHSAGDLRLRVEFNTFDAAGLATFVQQVLGAQN